MSRIHNLELRGRLGELRYHCHTVAMIERWTRQSAKTDRRVGTTVARMTFVIRGDVNRFWLKMGPLTHLALPTLEKGTGPRRVYELIACDLEKCTATFRTPPVAIEEPRR